MNNEVMFSSKDMILETPRSLFELLNEEFHFTLDPCCTMDTAKCKTYYTPKDDGLSKSWAGYTVFMNPPYGREILKWIKKAYEESNNGTIVVCLIPSRTDTKYWHEYCMKASEIRFIKGRIKFGNASANAPFPSAIVVFNGNKSLGPSIQSYGGSGH